MFTKNSDRPAFDCQPLVYRPRRQWPAGSRIAMEYLEVPQVAETYAHLGSRPYWSFGYESGLNEHGVVIGNEAIFTRAWRAASTQHRRDGCVACGVSGMDVIRLALERTRSASEAVDLIGRLVEAHGHFGSGVPGKAHADGSYDNSFIVADAAEAWVLETCGRDWLGRRLSNGSTSISNQPTLRSAWDRASRTLEANMIAQGWWSPSAGRPFDFAAAVADDLVPRQVSHLRLMRSRQLLRERAGRIDSRWMRRIARDHYENTFLEGPLFNPADPDVHTLCMHDSPAGFTWGNTAASSIVVQPRGGVGVPVFWWAPGPPCNSCYVPFFVPANGVPSIVSQPGATYAPDAIVPPDQASPDTAADGSYWWLFHRLLEATTGGAGHRGSRYAERNPMVRARFDALETQFEAELPQRLAAWANAADGEAAGRVLADFTGDCVNRVVAAATDLLRQFGEGK
jgi:secernin